ncbi:Indolepyruvate oxidoreductase subunit IorA [anaerobic digester metagenome]|uniref:Indolepyruvate oxidoreductase subunit IorA n=1 Tax=anaerobic digester metagenome TaxID=1263854 RepID=A0A485M0X5_9ZZZZ
MNTHTRAPSSTGKQDDKAREILLGNEAIAHGIIASGANVVASYPGTPASEVCTTAMNLASQKNLAVHVEWSINEKTAVEVAFTNSITGRRSAAIMKQVGLNVASDPVISAAYMGVTGGLVLVVADDPGPHSSQTEQDTRLFAMHAKVPVLDPMSPREALEMTVQAFAFSERYRTPVILRPTTRVCHARQLVELPDIKPLDRRPDFRKDPSRWAATPGPRLVLHRELNAKLREIEQHPWARPRLVHGSGGTELAVVSSGVACAYLLDVIAELGTRQDISIYKIDMPFPLDRRALSSLTEKHPRVLVVEETEPVIEMQFINRERVSGRMDGTVPDAGELTPEVVAFVLEEFTGTRAQKRTTVSAQQRRPSLCAGCSHRAAFYAIKRALPGGIYASDIGCYTLGLNLGGVDTCLCMGAAVSQAAGFFHAFKDSPAPPPIAAIIGDSTFFHAGIPPTINALVTGARFVLVVLDNATTAMTGHQPTPATGGMTNDFSGRTLSLEEAIAGCGVRTIRVHDPYDMSGFTDAVREAYARTETEGVTAVIARHPCIKDRRALQAQTRYAMRITEECTGCGVCVREFECPAISVVDRRARIDTSLCIGCGVCVQVCPVEAIAAKEES